MKQYTEVWHYIFSIKASLAFVLGLAGLGYMAARIKTLHEEALFYGRVINKAVDIDPLNPSCWRDVSQARLMTPSDKLITGFHLDWQKTTPITIVRQLGGFRPSV